MISSISHVAADSVILSATFPITIIVHCLSWIRSESVSLHRLVNLAIEFGNNWVRVCHLLIAHTLSDILLQQIQIDQTLLARTQIWRHSNHSLLSSAVPILFHISKLDWGTNGSFRPRLHRLCLTEWACSSNWLSISDLSASLVLFDLCLMYLTLVPDGPLSTLSLILWHHVDLKLLDQFLHIFPLLLVIQQLFRLCELRLDPHGPVGILILTLEFCLHR